MDHPAQKQLILTRLAECREPRFAGHLVNALRAWGFGHLSVRMRMMRDNMLQSPKQV